MNYSEEIKERQKINRLLVTELHNLVETYPTARFGQILLNHFYRHYNSVDRLDLGSVIYNEEPAKTLGKLMLSLEDK